MKNKNVKIWETDTFGSPLQLNMTFQGNIKIESHKTGGH
jgi:hypothetical protein